MKVVLPPAPIAEGIRIRARFREEFAAACLDVAERMGRAYGGLAPGGPAWDRARIADAMAAQARCAAANPAPCPVPVGARWCEGSVDVYAALDRLRAVLAGWVAITGAPIDEPTTETLVAMARRAGLGEEVLLG